MTVRGWPVLALCAASTACGSRASEFEEPIQLMDPAAIEDHLILIDQTEPEALIMKVTSREPSPRPRRAPLPANPRVVERRLSDEANELLVLSAGRTVDEDKHKGSEPPALTVLDSTGVDRTYRFETRFNAMVQSDDGRYAVLFFDAQAAEEVDSLAFSRAEIAIVDLDAPPDAKNNPHVRNLRSLGSAPQDVVFSPEMEIAGQKRRLAVVLFGSDISVLDLSHLERPEFTIPLAGKGRGSLGLTQVLFDADEGKIYVRGAATNDVYVISLPPSNGTAENDFVPSRNQHGAGNGPSDMGLFKQGDSTRLLVTTTGAPEAVVVNTASSEETSIPLETVATRLYMFEAEAPFEPDERKQRALLYSEESRNVTFLDLDKIEEQRALNVETLDLEQAYGRVVPLEHNLVLLIHQDSGLSLLDLAERTVLPYDSTKNLIDAIPDPDVEKLWLAPRRQNRVGYVDLADFGTSQLYLDAPVDHILLVPSPDHPRVIVTHDSSLGYVTIIDAKKPDEQQALRGFLFDSVLEGGKR